MAGSAGARFSPRIFHPTDFSVASEVAFAHALKLALVQRAELRIMHIGKAPQYSRWLGFPEVRNTLSRWGLLPAGSPRAAVARLGMKVEKILIPRGNPATGILAHLEEYPADLVVLATHQRRGPARWMHQAVAAPVSRTSRAMALFVPPKVPGFVSLEDGAVRLERILIPVDQRPHPGAAVQAIARLCECLGLPQVSFTFLHVGEHKNVPELHPPQRAGWQWKSVRREGEVVSQILRVMDDIGAELIAMATQGEKGFLDALRGSTTERVVRKARCPVLAIPMAWRW